MKIISKTKFKPGKEGMSLVELMTVVVILAVALLALVGSLWFASRLIRQSGEVNIAKNAVRGIIESMRMYDTDCIYAYYNSDPGDDPNGYGTAPGNGFSVKGLDPQAETTMALSARLNFPRCSLAGEWFYPR